MSLVGLSAKAIDLKSQKPMKKCDRCGLKYPEGDETCFHCGEMNESELFRFKEKLADESKANSNLGVKFLIAASIIVVILFLSIGL